MWAVSAWDRAQAKAMMLDSCLITRAGAPTQDSDGWIPTAGTPVTVPCLAAGYQLGAMEGLSGGQRGERGAYQWSVPYNTDVREQDTLTYPASGGIAYVVIGVSPTSELAADRTVYGHR